MKQIETLNLIRARCVELLKQAKLRTPGAWSTPHFANDNVSCNCKYVLSECYMGAICTIHANECPEKSIADGNGDDPPMGEAKANAAYIANASVAFEAALESTIVAIDLLEGFNGVMGFDSSELFTTKRIIAAWKYLLP